MLGRIGRYHRGEAPDSRDVPPVDSEGYAFPCPRCGFEYVHVIGARTLPGPYEGRLTAEVGLSCENGCYTSLVLGNYKGLGYYFWTDGAAWVSPEARATLELETPPEMDELIEHCKSFPEIHETPFHILETNMQSNQKGTARQISWLQDLCKGAELDEATLIWLGVELGRLHPRRLNMNSEELACLTKPEVGGLIAFVGFLKSRAGK